MHSLVSDDATAQRPLLSPSSLDGHPRVVKSDEIAAPAVHIQQIGLTWVFILKAISTSTWSRAEFSFQCSLPTPLYVSIKIQLKGTLSERLDAIYLFCRAKDESQEKAFELAAPFVFTGGVDQLDLLVKLPSMINAVDYRFILAFQGSQTLNCTIHSMGLKFSNDTNVGNFHRPRFTGSTGGTLVERRAEAAIVICIHNSLSVSLACIQSVLKTRGAGHIMVVINDGSTPEVGRQLRALLKGPDEVVYVEDRTGSGYTKAVNRGIGLVDAEVYILINSDTLVPEGWIERLIAPFQQSHSKLGIVGPFSNRATLQSLPLVEEGEGWATNNIVTTDNFEYMDRALMQTSHHTRLSLLPAEVVNGFCMAVHRQVFEAIGLFDENVFATGYGEETDFQMRALDHDFCFAIVPNLLVYHHGSSSYENYDLKAYQDVAFKHLLMKHGTERVMRSYLATRSSVMDFSQRDIIAAVFQMCSSLHARWKSIDRRESLDEFDNRVALLLDAFCNNV